MKARRFWRIASRPSQSDTPRLQVASSTKQSKPLPNVLSSISFQKAKSHSGASFFVKVTMFIVFCCVLDGLRSRRIPVAGPKEGRWIRSQGSYLIILKKTRKDKEPTITANRYGKVTVGVQWARMPCGIVPG